MARPTRTFDHYELVTDEAGEYITLGRGGMGSTFKARHTRLDKFYAVKVMNLGWMAARNVQLRFLHEARIAAKIDHPNVVHVVHVSDAADAECYYVMELIEGASLQERLDRSGPLPVCEALEILCAVADALTALAGHGLVHRDIKPANIMLARTGPRGSRVKLIDFGLVKPLDQSLAQYTTEMTAERLIGTAHFASPEQFQPGARIDARADFYSLGGTLWCALTGLPPNGGQVDMERWHRESEPPWERIATLPGAVQTLLRRLLAKDRDLRPPDAERLLAEWEGTIAATAGCILEPLPRGGAPTPQEAAGTVIDDGETPPETPPTAPAPEAEESDAEELIGNLGQAPLAEESPPQGRIDDAWETMPVDQPLPGQAPPPASATLAREIATGIWLALRRVPRELPAETRAEFLDAANAAAMCPHAGLLNVRFVRADEVASDWPPGVPATTVLARQSGALPPGVVLAWLPKVAQAVDWACVHGFARLGLDAARWLVSFETVEEGETPETHAARPPFAWGDHFVRLDPLAGFDPILSAGLAGDVTVLAERATDLGAPAEYLAALARAIYELLGGRGRERPTPLGVLGDAGNALLFAALEQRSNFPSAQEWAEALLECAGGAQREPAATAPAPAPKAVAPPPRPTAPPPRPRQGKRFPRPTAIVLIILALLVGGILWQHGRDSAPQPDPVAPLLVEARTALAAHDVTQAEEKMNAARQLPPGDLRVAALEAELEQEQLFRQSAEQQRLATNRQRKLETATNEKDNHFINSLEMEFVPVPIEGGPTDGKRVLFCIWDTRVKDFTAFVDATDHYATARMYSLEIEPDGKDFNPRQAGRTWKSPGFSQTGEHPVVGVSWEDAQAFCAWLTKTEHASGNLPAGYSYRLPSDAEWSAAVGESEYPWGEQDSPPKGAGNYAGEESKAGMPANWGFITGYDDGYPRTSPVGRFKENKFGLYDMGGNVWQWCEDWYRKEMNSAELRTEYAYLNDDEGQKYRVLRGGGWSNSDRNRLLSSYRGNVDPGNRYAYNGFRCVVAISAR